MQSPYSTLPNPPNTSPPHLPTRDRGNETGTPETITVYTDGACINNGRENAATGSGTWYGENDPHNTSTRVAHKKQSNQTGELMAVLEALKNNLPESNLKIVSDSKYVIDSLTKFAEEWEAHNWSKNQNGEFFKCITAWVRSRQGTTSLKWIKGHEGNEGNEGADKLAGEGAKKPLTINPELLRAPLHLTATSAKLASLEQKDLYRIISSKRRIPTRSRADKIVSRIQACAESTFGSPPKMESVWLATKHKNLTRKTRDFLWKSTQHAYKIGEFWGNIPGYEDRGTCPLCDELEDMDHILTSCKSKARSTAWTLANDLWRNRSHLPLPTNLGDILGCALASFNTNGKPDTSKNRLYSIIVSETAFLIWKLRNERRIRDEDSQEHGNIATETTNRWINAINKRLTIDRLLTNDKRFGKRALNKKLVKSTWRGCVKNEENLPTNWHWKKEVLVGISWMSPLGHVR